MKHTSPTHESVQSKEGCVEPTQIAHLASWLRSNGQKFTGQRWQPS